MDSLIVSIYNGASSIATPLSLAALIASFFFFICKLIVESLQEALKKLLPEDALKVLLRVLTYFFILSLVALVGGIGCYAAQYLLKDYVERQRHIDAAQDGVNQGDIAKILSNAVALINSSGRSKEPIGYKFEGIGLYFKKDYTGSSDAFKAGIALFPAGTDVCSADLNAFKGNLAAAQGAAGNYEDGLKTLDEIEKCKPRPKMDAFNRAKLLLAANRLDDAAKALEAPELLGPDQPDIRSRVWLEKAIVAIVKKDNGWEADARKTLASAILYDPALKRILCFSDGQAAPGWTKVEDFRLEQSIAERPENQQYFESLKNEKLSGCAQELVP